jgi:hypothetical protein
LSLWSCGKAEFGQISRSFSLHAEIIIKRPKNLTQIGFCPRAPSLDAAHQFTLPSLRSVKPDRLLEATSKGEMLSAMTAVRGSAGYVAIEQVSGSLSGNEESRYGADGQGASIYVKDPEGNVLELKEPPWQTADKQA